MEALGKHINFLRMCLCLTILGFHELQCHSSSTCIHVTKLNTAPLCLYMTEENKTSSPLACIHVGETVSDEWIFGTIVRLDFSHSC